MSIIIPVYNVEKYLRECLNSVLNQTYKNLEIILIDDGSTDGSGYICDEYKEKDKRIIVIHQENHGLGPARNLGVQLAKGEYISFVDADDMIANTFIEKLYTAITEDDCDIAECSYSKIRGYTNQKEYMPCTSIMNRSFTLEERLLLGNVTLWKMMTKKSLWTCNDITQPALLSEDVCTYPILIFSADKISNVDESLYFYRKERSGSILTSSGQMERFGESIDYVLRELVNRGFFENKKREIGSFIRRRISRRLSTCLGHISFEEYRTGKKNLVEIYKKYFDSKNLKEELLWGSFNLSKIVNKLELIEDPFCRFNFSSIISLNNSKKINIRIKHDNIYRQTMLERECGGLFFDALHDKVPKLVFIDLLEERHDIIEINGTYLTKSEAFDGSNLLEELNYRIISRESEECSALWMQSCDIFMEHLLDCIQINNIFLIENYLSEQYGDGKVIRYFSQREDIKRKNRVLAEYYSYIKKKYHGITVIKAYTCDEYHTDENYEYGCYPWHLNEWVNIRIARMIEEKMQLQK